MFAVDIGGSKILAAAATSGRPELDVVLERPTRPSTLPGDVRRLLEGLVRECGREPEVIGVASVGPLDYSRLEIVGAPNLGGGRISLVGAFDNLGAPVIVANDAVAALWGEVVFGKARGLRDAVMIVLGTGVGGAALVDGRLVLGRRGGAHEVGHIVIDYSSKWKCGCGGIGHWEALAGARWLPRLIESLTGGRVRYETPSEAVDWLRRGLASGDREARLVLRELARVNAAGIASIIAVYDPEAVFLAGGLFEAIGDWLLPEIARFITDYSIYEPPRIEAASFGRLQALYGAYAIAYRTPSEILALNTHRLAPRGV